MILPEEISTYMYQLVSRHALSPEEREYTDIFSTERGGHGTRGYSVNAQGLEIGWWVHPERYVKEIKFLVQTLSLKGHERILSLGCGPAFHEIVLAKFYPQSYIVATDSDEREIHTAQHIALEIGVSNITFHPKASENIMELNENELFDCIISMAALHDVPDFDGVCKSLTKMLKKGGLLVTTYNPDRRKIQFPKTSLFEEVVSRYFRIEETQPLITAEDSARYYGSFEGKSRVLRGYSIVQNVVVMTHAQWPLANINDIPLKTKVTEGIRGAQLIEQPTLSCAIMEIQPRQGFDPHLHPQNHLLVIMQGSGHLNYREQDQEYILPLKQGDVLVVPPNIVHATKAGSDGMRFLVVDVPGSSLDNPQRIHYVEGKKG